MNKTTWQDWYAELSGAFARLTDTCDHVVVAGLSMGGALVTKLIAQLRKLSPYWSESGPAAQEAAFTPAYA